MSIEQSIENLAKVIDNLTKLFEKQMSVEFEAHESKKVIESPVVPQVQEPVKEVVPPFVSVPIKEGASAAIVPNGPPAPFTDNAGLIKYVMETYTTLGPDKSSKMQEVLDLLGYKNKHVNDVKPEHYNALYAAFEALKK